MMASLVQMSFLELAASRHMCHLVQEYLIHSPCGLGACGEPLLVRLLAATVSDIVRNHHLSNFPLAIELLEALPELVPTSVNGDIDDPLSQLIVDLKSQYAVYQLYSMEEGANSLANFTTLLSRHFDSVPSWGDVKVQEYTAELHAAAKQRLEDLAGSPEKKACYWRDYVLNEVQTQAVWESLEKGVTALLSKVEASLPKPVLVQACNAVSEGPTEQKQHSAARDLKASIQSQAVMVLCSHLPQTVLGPKLKDLQCRQVTTLSDAGHDTTASLDGCSPSTSETETDVKELERKELVEDLHAQSMSSPSKRWLKYKRGQSSSGSASSLSKRRKRRISDDSSNASSTAIPEQQDGGVQANVSKSPLKSPRRPAAARGDPFICVLDSEEEGGEKTTEAVEELQEGEDLNTVASICEVFELP